MEQKPRSGKRSKKARRGEEEVSQTTGNVPGAAAKSSEGEPPESHGARTSTPSPSPPPSETPNETTDAPPSAALANGQPLDSSILARLRLSQNFGEQSLVERVITVVPIRKPARNEFFRTRLGSDWRFQSAMLISREEQESQFLFVDPDVQPELLGELRPVELVLSISKGGTIFLWPIILPDDSGRWNQWHQSAAEAAKVAETRWIKIVADRAANGYAVFAARGVIPEPTWPALGMSAILDLALKDRYIRSMDHPVIRRLQGMI